MYLSLNFVVLRGMIQYHNMMPLDDDEANYNVFYHRLGMH
jgi:hypothetical protein